MVVLDESVRMVVLQFSFSNERAVPQSVRHLDRETHEDYMVRKTKNTVSARSGMIVINPTDKCSLEDFLGELEEAGYDMVDAVHQERIDLKDSRGRRIYHMVRFLFDRYEFAIKQEASRADLRNICETSIWRVRVFLNPFFQPNGRPAFGQYAVNICLEARQPLFYPNGKPVMVWQKDEYGNRLFAIPSLLKPDHWLHIVDNAITVA